VVRQAILAAIAHYGQVFLCAQAETELYRFQTRVANLTQDLGHKPPLKISRVGYDGGERSAMQEGVLKYLLRRLWNDGK